MRNRLIFFVIAGAVLVASCGSSSASPSGDGAPESGTPSAVATGSAEGIDLTGTSYRPAPPERTGGTLTVAEWQFPKTINPYYANFQYERSVAAGMFDNLVDVTPDLKYVPDLVATVPTLENGGVKLTSGGGMDVSWKLKSGMQWSDGNPIRCADLEATWRWIMDPANTTLSGGTTGWDDITGVGGGDSTDCVIHFKRIYEGYLTLVSPLLPKQYLESVPVSQAAKSLYPLDQLDKGVYSGPYIPGSATAPNRIDTLANPRWKTISGHAPYLHGVTWRYYGSAEAMIDAYRDGVIDVAQDLTDAELPSAATIEDSQKIIANSLTREVLVFNNKSFQTKFANDSPIIIEAIKRATDRQAIASGPLGGRVSATNDLVSPLTWYHSDVQGNTNPDPTGASTVLANAGWTKGADGLLVKEGTKLSLDFCTTTRQVRIETAQLVAAQLKSIGITVNVLARPAPDVFGEWNSTPATTPCNLKHGNFDVAEFAYASSFDPLVGYGAYHSTANPDDPPHDGQNISRISLARLDRAYDTVSTSVDFAAIRSAMYEVQDVYGSDQNTYELPLYWRKDVWLIRPNIHNVIGGPTALGAEWNIGDWWID